MERSERIKFLRDQKGLTQVNVAKLTGCTPGYVSQIENGIRKPSIKFVEKFCRALDISADLVLVGDTEVTSGKGPSAVREIRDEYGHLPDRQERRLVENAPKRMFINKVLRVYNSGNKKVVKALISNIDAFLFTVEMVDKIKGID